MKRHCRIYNIVIAAAIVVLGLAAHTDITFAAMNHDEIVEQVYKDLVTKGSNATTFICDDPAVICGGLIDDIHGIDNEDTLFDGIMLDIRGKEIITQRGNEYTITIENAYDISEADALTDKMVEEIKETLPENSTEKEVFYEIGRYIKKTFTYDKDAYYGDKQYTNFVDAYNGDRKINCEGFAAVTYLITKKMGLDSKLFLGEKHVYNGIRFDNEDKYTAVDFSSDQCPSGLVPGIAIIDPQYKGNADTKNYASICDIIKAVGYNLTHQTTVKNVQ